MDERLVSLEKLGLFGEGAAEVDREPKDGRRREKGMRWVSIAAGGLLARLSFLMVVLLVFSPFLDMAAFDLSSVLFLFSKSLSSFSSLFFAFRLSP